MFQCAENKMMCDSLLIYTKFMFFEILCHVSWVAPIPEDYVGTRIGYDTLGYFPNPKGFFFNFFKVLSCFHVLCTCETEKHFKKKMEFTSLIKRVESDNNMGLKCCEI